MNILAAIDLFARSDNKKELIADGLLLSEFYPLNAHQLAKTDKLKAVIDAAANIFDQLSELSDDPAELENIRKFLASL